MFLFRRSRSKTPANAGKADPDKKQPQSSEQSEILTEGHVGRILMLEERYRNEPFSPKLVEEIVQLYAKAVEYCDSIKAEPLRSYFKEKIGVIATELIKKPEKQAFSPEAATLKKQFDSTKVSQARKDIYDQPIKAKELQSYRDKKSRQWNFEANLIRQVEEEAKTMDTVMNKRSLLRNNDQIVKENLQSQQDALQEKLRQRRDRSFNKSMNRMDDKSVDESRPKQGESFFRKKKDETEDDLDKEALATNILKLLDDIGPGKVK